MENKRRILVIENQFVQFKEIIKLLDQEGYQSFPDEKSFIDFIDAVKIFLNPRYTSERQTSFLEKLLDMTKQFNPELLIIDHILVGTHNTQDGVDLAIKFREKGLKQPIIFFSRTTLNNIEICDKLPQVSHLREWVFKGYSGEEILDPTFFKKEVVKKIEELLSKSEIKNSEEYITDNLIPFINELLKIKIEANSRNVYNVGTDSILLLEQLKDKINTFLTSQKIVPQELKNEFLILKSVTTAGHFEDEQWESACSNLIKIIDGV